MIDKKENFLKDKNNLLEASKQELVQIVKRSAEFTEEILKENERLRYKIAQFESCSDQDGADESLINELMAKVKRLEGERERIIKRFAEVEAENQDFASRYLEIENENNNLLNIYVASYQLHSTLEFAEVLQILTEIIINFVGAEIFAIALVTRSSEALQVVVHEGIVPDALGEMSIEQGVIGKVIESGQAYFVSDFSEEEPIKGSEPGICIPLKIKDKIIGAILIYRFFQQKKQLAAVDHELFTLLAGHAATAIFSSKLYTDSKRKLDTIQGFIDLMSSESQENG